MAQTISKRTLITCFTALGIFALVLCPISGVSAGEKKLDLELCSPDQEFVLEISNPYILYDPPDRQWRLVGEEDDETIIVRITVLEFTETLYENTSLEMETRVVEELEAVDVNEDGVIQNEEVIEQSFNYYAQTLDGTVCYLDNVLCVIF